MNPRSKKEAQGCPLHKGGTEGHKTIMTRERDGVKAGFQTEWKLMERM